MASVDKAEALRRAQRALQIGRAEEAKDLLWALVDRSHVVDEEFQHYLNLLSRAYSDLGRARAAATIRLYLGDVAGAQQLSQGVPIDLARCAIAMGAHDAAARYFQDAGWIGHAAIHLELAKNDRSARVLWERLADDVRLTAEPYTQALVRFNLGRACARLGDRQASRRALIQSMHLLEAAADGFEARGLRERAFDCFQVLLTLGRDGAFENLAEGYLNCIRILKEDYLKYYVLQYYEDFQQLALERGELHAAATLYREAAEFARGQMLPYDRHYRRRAAETHVLAAQKTLRDGGPVELAENALAAAIDAFNDLGAYTQVRGVYTQLAQLPLPEKRRGRYTRLRERLADIQDENAPVVTFPDYLRMDAAYPEIWRLDVIEWEQHGDPAETMSEVLQDPKWPEFTRRRALLCRLHQLGSGERAWMPINLATLAAHLGRVEIYASLSPLERLAEHEDASVRAACLRAARQLYFKRSFILVRAGLADPQPEVRKEALEAVSALHFPHAFDPLARIYRESTDADVRRAALASIGKITTLEAVEMLVDVLRHGDPNERRQARELLEKSEHQDVTTILRRTSAGDGAGARTTIDEILRARGPY